MMPRSVVFLTNIIFSIVEFLLAVRILLRFFGASTVAPFVRWSYDTTAPLLAPFAGMFPTPVLEGGLVLEFSAMFALVVYAFIAYIITEAVRELSYRSMRRK